MRGFTISYDTPLTLHSQPTGENGFPAYPGQNSSG